MVKVTAHRLSELIRDLASDMAEREHNAPSAVQGCIKCQMRRATEEAGMLAAELLNEGRVNV